MKKLTFTTEEMEKIEEVLDILDKAIDTSYKEDAITCFEDTEREIRLEDLRYSLWRLATTPLLLKKE